MCLLSDSKFAGAKTTDIEFTGSEIRSSSTKSTSSTAGNVNTEAAMPTPEQVDADTLLRAEVPQTHPEFDRLVRTIWRLRQPDGCPWDRVQTHDSITSNLIEEAYEAVDTIETGDVEHLLEEMGDLLEQVLLHSQIASDAHEFTIDDVCRELNEKLVRRHPHVFGSGEAADAEAALDSWDAVKRQERQERRGSLTTKERQERQERQERRGSLTTKERQERQILEEPGLLDSIPRGMPALMQCQKISKRAAKAGFEWETTADVWNKVAEEQAEFEREIPGTEQAEMEFGDILFALVNVARKEGIDAEQALRRANDKFRRRWSEVERAAQESGCRADELSTEELNELWDEIKSQSTT